MILVLLPSQVLANNYFCTIERMGQLMRLMSPENLSQLKILFFQIKSNSVKFSDKGWFVKDRMDIRLKESGGKIVLFLRLTIPISSIFDNKLWASTF